MNYNYIVNPLTNRKCSIHTRNGQKILSQYINQNGGACGFCGADGVNKSTCPHNPANIHRKDKLIAQGKHNSTLKGVARERPVEHSPRVDTREPKHENILIGPNYASGFLNAKLASEKDQPFSRNFLIFGEAHLPYVFDEKSLSVKYFPNWIENIAKTYEGCIDFFLEGMFKNSMISIDPQTMSMEYRELPTIKSKSVIDYRVGGGGEGYTIDKLRNIFNPQIKDRTFSQVVNYPNFRYHFVDIRQIYDHSDYNKNVNLMNIYHLQESIIKGCLEILQNINNQIIDALKRKVSIDKYIIDYFLGSPIHPPMIKSMAKGPILYPLKTINNILGNCFDFILDKKEYTPLTKKSFDSVIDIIFQDEQKFRDYMNLLYKNNIVKKEPELHIKLIQCLIGYVKHLSEHIDEINNSTLFIKGVIDKQFKKSVLTKDDFYNNRDIWNKIVDKEFDNILDFSSLIMIMDIYTLCRMFAKFDKSKMERGPKACRGEMFSQPRNIIFYGGSLHAEVYTEFIKRMTKTEPIFVNKDGRLTGDNWVPYDGITPFFRNAI
uniref:Uncharacterized protein n=1 Tax=viral metagenome TaxID=1070528 RepID=A0A6C0JFH0_9ZZZZ